MTTHPFISTRGLREPLGPEEPHDTVDVEPTPQEKFDHAMSLVDEHATNCGRMRLDEPGPLEDFLATHKALSDLFWDIYGLDNE